MVNAEKKSPLRMCVACREMRDKREMLRIVKSSDGEIALDYTSKKAGRGAYICDSEACLRKCVKSRLINRAFKCDVPSEIYDKILEDYLSAKR